MVPLSCEFDILTPRLLALLAKRMQHVDSVAEFGNVKHAPLTQDVNTNLSDTRPDIGHWFPVRWIESSLNGIKLKASLSPGLGREIAQVIQTGPDKSQWFHQGDYTTTLIIRRNCLLAFARDDFGAQSNTAWAREKLYQLVTNRVNNDLPTVVTSNWIERQFAFHHSRIASRVKAAVHVHIAAPDARSAAKSG
jgi:hypothetical protein